MWLALIESILIHLVAGAFFLCSFSHFFSQKSRGEKRKGEKGFYKVQPTMESTYFEACCCIVVVVPVKYERKLPSGSKVLSLRKQKTRKRGTAVMIDSGYTEYSSSYLQWNDSTFAVLWPKVIESIIRKICHRHSSCYKIR